VCTIIIAVDAKITITSNIWKRVGILNGANGTIKAILYPIKKDYKTLPHTIIVHIPIYWTTIYTEPVRTNWIPINPFTYYSIQANGHRTQMPLAYAMTVHKSQGQTLKLGVIDFTNIERSLGSSYVQLTRFQNIKQFLVMPFPFSRITTQIKKSISLKPRMAEEERLNTLAQNTLITYSYLLLNE